MVEAAHARVLPGLGAREQAGEKCIFDQLGWAAALQHVFGGVLPQLRLSERAALGDARQALLLREGGHLARQRCRRRALASVLRQPDRVIVQAEGVVAEVVLAQDADRVHDALEHVLEHAAQLADRDQHVVAVEGALALADRLEAIRGFFQPVHGRHRGLARRAFVTRRAAGARDVEAREPRRVRLAGLLVELGGEPRPQRAGPCDVRGTFVVDGGAHELSFLFQLARRPAIELRGGIGPLSCPRSPGAGSIDGGHVVE